MIVLANGKVITRDPDGTGYLSDGGVVTDGGKIVEVGTTADLKAKYPQAEFVDARGGDIMQTAFDFTEGWTPAAGAQAVNLLMYDPLATVAPIVYDTSMMSAPTAQSKGHILRETTAIEYAK